MEESGLKSIVGRGPINNTTVFSQSRLVSLVSFAFLTSTMLLWIFNEVIDHSTYWTVQVDWFLYLNTLFSHHPEFWFNMTELGDAFILIPLLSFFIIIRPQIWVAFFAAIPAGLLLSHGGKALASMPRPAAVIDHSLITIVGDTLTGHNSLPSGHTTTIFAAATIIVLVSASVTNRNTRLSMIGISLTVAVLVALSRIAVGAHWPLDVVIGAFFGFLSGLSGIAITQRYTSWCRWMTSELARGFFGLLLLFWCVSIIADMAGLQRDATLVAWCSVLSGTATSIYLLRFSVIRSRLKLE